MNLRDRFRTFLPIVVDVETGGVDPDRHALLELCVVIPNWSNDKLVVVPEDIHLWDIAPYDPTAVESDSLKVTNIDLSNESREAQSEDTSIRECFRIVRRAIRAQQCTRAIATGHNTHFDLAFIKAAAMRNDIKRDPFHPFSVLDTVSLSAMVYGHTVLSVACERAGLEFDAKQAHGALYDATVTAQLFCKLINAMRYEGFDSD